MNIFVSALWLVLCGGVNAHEGYGLPSDGHWHASEVWGFVALATAAGAALWWSRRK